MKRLLVLTLIVGTIAGLLVRHGGGDQHKPLRAEPPTAQRPQAGPVAGGQSTPADKLTAVLTEALGAEQPAVAITRCVGRAAADLLENDQLLVRARELNTPAARALLEKFPQCFGLLLLQDADERTHFIEAISSLSAEEDRERLVSSCLKHAEVNSLRAWTVAVGRHPSLIAQLLRQSPAWPVDQILTFERESAGVRDEGAAAYDPWLETVLAPDGVLRPTDEAASLLQFLARSGPEIRRKLRDDPVFRERFPREIWGKVSRAVEHLAAGQKQGPIWHLTATSPSLWKLMEMPDGEALFGKGGALAADLLCSEEPGVALPTVLRERAATVILNENQLLLNGFIRYGTNPNFQRLVARLNDDLMARACRELDARGENYPELLAEWEGISTDGMESELGPPPSPFVMALPGVGLAYSTMKVVQGRKVTPQELIGNLKDTFAVGSGFIREGVQEGLKNYARTYVKNLVTDAAKGAFSTRPAGSKGARAAELKDPFQEHAELRRAHSGMDDSFKRGPFPWSDAPPEAPETRTTPPVSRALAEQLARSGVHLWLLTPTRTALQLDPAPVAVLDSAYRREAADQAKTCRANPASREAWQSHLGPWFLHLAATPDAPAR
ncbi:MAG TPA: hypothetical protein VGO11_07190 [Chthoniobacteraceae bacterium]|jgi:hypothetical protein|nr:hypothetical protein [Chthoniobacteraceae bacterium]